MNEFILILTLSLSPAGETSAAVATAEYSSKEACEKAAAQWTAAVQKRFNSAARYRDKAVFAICTPKK